MFVPSQNTEEIIQTTEALHWAAAMTWQGYNWDRIKVDKYLIPKIYKWYALYI